MMITDSTGGLTTETFEYDPLNRLKKLPSSLQIQMPQSQECSRPSRLPALKEVDAELKINPYNRFILAEAEKIKNRQQEEE